VKQTRMCRAELLETLADTGITVPILRYCVQRGVITTDIDGCGNRIYTDAHVESLRRYMATPRRRGRKPRKERVA